MLSKEQERVTAIEKIKTTIYELCSKIGEIDREVLEFIVQDPWNIPSELDIVKACPAVIRSPELAYNVLELYNIFNLESQVIPSNMQCGIFMDVVLRTITFPEALSEVRASFLDTAPVSEISVSTLDTTMGTNSSVLHGSSDYCEL